jgi:hypothetical protein
VHGWDLTPREDDKGNFDDTEFPADSDNHDHGRQRSASPSADSGKRANSDDEGDYDDKDQ